MIIREPSSSEETAGTESTRPSGSVRPSALTSGLLVGEQADQVGLYHHDLIADRWTWSPELYRIHGFDPDGTEPTTELLVAHKHPEDRQYFVDVVADARATGASFSCRHRIVTTDQQHRLAIMIGEVECGDDGTATAMHGYFVDLGAESDAQQSETSEVQHLRYALASRVPIEQAKGMIMHAYGCTATAAFRILITVSQSANRKLRLIAEELTESLTTGSALPEMCRQALENQLHQLSTPDGGHRR